ncbi:MAG TPA: NAD(P)/FAD-dependent oxidoreductase [Frankiaceae bacterium]|nr:NAD(P)/FAD-dependent oxidoreductase [Frankiaceae bacterium]
MSKPRVAVIGAGPGGLCMAIKLKAAGYDDFVILERGGGVGGTWYQNRYPGCACDIQSHLYSYSFEIKPDWTRPYATQPEILAYMEHCAAKYGILPHCRFGSEVVRASWNESSSSWTVELRSGDLVEADVVISALGMFNELSWPDIEGLGSFAGTSFHSAQWNWDHDLTGESVGVIGSAASAVQFVPEIVKQAGQVHLFQRTANWVLPKMDDPATPEVIAARLRDPALGLAIRREIFNAVDSGQTFSNLTLNAEREASVLAAMEVVEDPEVRAKLVPTHPYGCKRPLNSNNYYSSFNRPNLELVTDPIERITSDAIVTADGRERRVDTLIIATGFAATRYLSAIDVVGRDGCHISEAWNDGAVAYLGITTAGFPNLFMLYGPNTNNGSILMMIEYQVDHVMGLLERLRGEELAWLDVRPDVMHSYNEEVQEAIAGVQVWQAGCNGYYRTPSGRVVTQWPYSMTEFKDRSSAIDPDAFEVAAR